MRVSLSLLLSTLALVAASAPANADDDLLVLNKDNFESTIAKGVWFIEHFSPYCGHCKHFEPTWRSLVKEVASKPDLAGIHLAQVNCIVDGDLCEANNIKGYPTLNLYHDGDYVETYKKSRDLGLLLEYTSLHAEKPAAAHDVGAGGTAVDLPVTTPSIPVPPSEYNTDGTVLVLTPQTFGPTLKKGPTFVKFFAPWCGHCKKLAPHWKDLAKHMQYKMTIAEVNCEDYGSLCKKEGIEGYPALYFYPGAGAERTEYLGGRKLEQLSAFADKANEPPVKTIQDEEVDAEIKQHDVVFLFVNTHKDSASTDQVTTAAKSLLGQAPVVSSSSLALSERFALTPSQPTLLVFKDHDERPYASSTSPSQWSAWMHAHKLPSSLELVADTFQSVMNAAHKPLVVLTAVDAKDDVAKAKVQEIAKAWRDETARYGGEEYVQFAWMDASRWASWLKSQYGITRTPATALVRHKDLIYWDTDASGQAIRLDANSVFSAIDGALTGKTSYKNSENFVERWARYVSGKLSWIEQVFFASLWRSLAFMGALVGLTVWGLIKFIDDDGDKVVMNGDQRVDVKPEKRRKGRAD